MIRKTKISPAFALLLMACSGGGGAGATGAVGNNVGDNAEAKSSPATYSQHTAAVRAELLPPQISPQGAVAMKAESGAKTYGEVRWVDVRCPREWQAGHLATAIHLPLRRLDVQAARQQLSKDQPLLVYCTAGVRARRAVNQLRDWGFNAAAVTPGGFGDLRALGVPVR